MPSTSSTPASRTSPRRWSGTSAPTSRRTCTPPGTPPRPSGFHWDDHDTVIFQLEGAKRWNLHGATRTDPLRLDVEAPEKPEGPPLAEVVLQAGDVLYVPLGWWHAVAAAQGRSPHLTCGLTPATKLHPPPCARNVPTVPGPPSAPPTPSSCARKCPRPSTPTSSRSSPPPWTPATPAARPPPSRTSATSPPTSTWSWPSPPSTGC
ncbi:JmjC domain-containing protein [Streptomyces sp. NPDC020858]|uniref:JmjC domain-containing protein n=1 Tax=Streptomyces sp. NPDC020858 TaxID=3365097 RepID=UPI0037974743